MSDNMNNHPNIPADDVYEQEIDQLWETIQADFTNEVLHKDLLSKAVKYFLLNRIARYYKDYLLEHPANELALKFQQDIINLSTITLLQRTPQDAAGMRTIRLVVKIIFLFSLVTLAGAFLHIRYMQKGYVERMYMKGKNAYVRSNLPEARRCFEVVAQFNPTYKEVQMHLSLIDELEQSTPSPSLPRLGSPVEAEPPVSATPTMTPTVRPASPVDVSGTALVQLPTVTPLPAALPLAPTDEAGANDQIL